MNNNRQEQEQAYSYPIETKLKSLRDYRESLQRAVDSNNFCDNDNMIACIKALDSGLSNIEKTWKEEKAKLQANIRARCDTRKK